MPAWYIGDLKQNKRVEISSPFKNKIAASSAILTLNLALSPTEGIQYSFSRASFFNPLALSQGYTRVLIPWTAHTNHEMSAIQCSPLPDKKWKDPWISQTQPKNPWKMQAAHLLIILSMLGLEGGRKLKLEMCPNFRGNSFAAEQCPLGNFPLLPVLVKETILSNDIHVYSFLNNSVMIEISKLALLNYFWKKITYLTIYDFSQFQAPDLEHTCNNWSLNTWFAIVVPCQ